MHFNNLKIGVRLGTTFALLAMLLSILGFVSYKTMAAVSNDWQNFSNVSMEKREIATQGIIKLGDAIHRFKNYILRGDDSDKLFADDLADIDAAASKFVNKGKMSARETALLNDISQGTQEYRAAIQKVGQQRIGGVAIAQIDHSINGADKKIGAAFGELLTITDEETKATGNSLTALVINGERWILGVSVIALMLATFCAWAISRSITGPLKQALKVAQTVAAGDLSSHIEVQFSDETGQLLQALKDMNQGLANIVGEVRCGTDQIATASSQIASGNQDLSSRTEQQAGSLEETASSIEEFTSTVGRNTDNAMKANSLAMAASAVAVKGGAVVSEVVETMNSINESSKKITEIISVIDGIAFQTNILALNAAVEAARAGEQGRGFAVVATEVRNLAQLSANAAKEIKALIDDSTEKVHFGSKLADHAGCTMVEIVASIKNVTDIMSEISTASQEQNASIVQIHESINMMDQVTQQNASLVEEAAAATDALRDQATKLSDVVKVFKLGSSVDSVSAAALKSNVIPLNRKTIIAPAIAPRPVFSPAKRYVC